MPATSIKSSRRSTQIRLDPDVRQALRDTWATTGQTQSDTVNHAVRKWLGLPRPPKPAA